MSELPRVQTIIAMVVISCVVIATLIVVSTRGGDTSSIAAASDPDAPPTAVPVLSKPRETWSTIADSVRGARGTAAPVACPFVDERVREENNFLSLTPGLTFVCEQQGLQATPIAPGRVVMRVTQAPLNSFKANLIANEGQNDGPWLRAAAYGPFVVVDHGPINDVSNVTSIYSGLETIDDDLVVGQFVDTSTPLGSLGARMINDELVNGVLTFELLTDDTRFGGDPVRQDPVSVSQTPLLADAVESAISLPVTSCSMPFGNLNLLVGANREYRSGTHNGLDFNCGTTNHEVTSAAAGQIIFVVNDYVDSSVEDREAVLAQTVPAFDTPFWTLAYLYGNFVVVDHEMASGERVVTIYAHLSEVDSRVLPGLLVDGGTPLGFVGNTGTSAAAEGIANNHGSVHLHWELHVNDRPIGYLEDPADTQPFYEQILCTPDSPSTESGC